MNALALAQLIANSGEGEALPLETAAWLRAGLRRWLRGDADLVIALHLNKGACAASRNRAIAQAAAILDDGRGLSSWELSKLLASAQARFEANALVQIQRGIDVPLTPLNEALLKAWRSGASPLRSARRIYDHLRK